MSSNSDIDRIINAYLLQTDLGELVSSARRIEANVQDLVASMGDLAQEVDEEALYRYPVPMLSEDGTCSIVDELSPTPYDLGAVLGGRGYATTRKLRLLHQLVERAVWITGADWLGIYQRRPLHDGSAALVKLAYRGRPSRAEFPLTREFARGSTNAQVGLSGRAKIIPDVESHTREGGAFYVCDTAVQSEACLPLFLPDTGQAAGIIDAEATAKSFFTSERLAVLVALALVAPACLI